MKKEGCYGHSTLAGQDMTRIFQVNGMLIEMYYLGDRSNSARVQKAISYLDNKDRWDSKGKENSYAMFSIYKGLKLMGINSLPNPGKVCVAEAHN